MPKIPHEQSKIDPTILGGIALALLCVTSAFGMYEYLTLKAPPHAAQAAATEQAIENPFASRALQAQAAYVYDLTTKRVLFERNAQKALPLASITKIMTALAVAEVLSPTDTITIPYDSTPSNNAAQLHAGDSWTVGDLLTYTLVASSNDGAAILADAANDKLHLKYPESPSEGATIWRMNNLAQELGLSSMHFSNVSGLDEDESLSGGYGSARDTALLFTYAASSAGDLFAGTAKNGVLLTSVNGAAATASNTNAILGTIPGLIMGKTGLTDLAGGNLGIVFEVGPAHPVVAVVLGSTETGRFADMQEIVRATQTAIAAGY